MNNTNINSSLKNTEFGSTDFSINNLEPILLTSTNDQFKIKN